MKWFINFYLDESGNNLSEFFTVGGFFIISSDHGQIQNIENKVKANILKTENSIKLYRKNNEQNLNQFILISRKTEYHKEVKWYKLSYDNKKFLINNIQNFNQQNTSIHCNLKRWITKNNKTLNLDAIYNIMVYHLVEKTLNKLNINSNEEIAIKIFIDQKTTLKINSKNNLESLEGYINTSLYLNSKFDNTKITVTQLDSEKSPLIRYADYYAGLTSSMCRIIVGSEKSWDKDIDIFFDTIHKHISCNCYATINNQCQTISKLCSKCHSINPI